MPDFDADRWNRIVSQGAFAQSVAIALDSSVFTVGCTVGKGFARKEVDGRLTTDEPLGTVSVVIHKSNLPSEITKDAYHALLFTIDGETYSVVNWTGHSIVRFFLKSSAEAVAEEDEPIADEGGEGGEIPPDPPPDDEMEL
jgi:hypothetical protein